MAGSRLELEAAIEELRLIRELHPRPTPAAGAVSTASISSAVATTSSSPRRRPSWARSRAAGAQPWRLGRSLPLLLTSASSSSTAARSPVSASRLTQLAEDFRYEEAARLRDRIDALEHVVDRLRRLDRLRTLDCCLVVPALEQGWKKAFFVCDGRISAVRSLPPGAAARPETDAALRQTARRSPITPEEAEDLLLLDGFIRRPPPELTVLPLRAEAA